MESHNTVLTSDFPHAVREAVEKQYGGTCLYISGDIGAVEIIGDSNNRNGDRTTFDGKDYPLKSDNNRPAYTFERTEAIGRDVAKAVFDALDHGELSPVPALDVRKATLRAPMDNQGYLFLSGKSVLDTMPPAQPDAKVEIETTVYAITMGEAQIITTPGELFPEVFYGVERFKRKDCAEADTKRPIEPSVRDRMTKKYKFVIGLCPDEFGYIVPRYDWRREPVDMQKLDFKRAVDPCKGVPNHYHETNSASSQLAPASACVTVALLTGRVPTDAACKHVTLHSDYVRELAKKNK